MLSIEIGTAFVVVGLMVDILGAVLIAFPDYAPLANSMDFGRLKSALNKLDAEGIAEGEEEFGPLTEKLAGIEPLERANEKPNPNYVRVEKNSRSGLAARESQDSPVNWGDEYIEGFYDEGNTFAYSDFYRLNDVYEPLRTEIRRQETHVRAGGFFLLSIGFGLQIVGTLI